MGERLRDGLRWLGAPVTLAALALLALNDAVLKHAWPGFVTGKLSDLAGLVVAPPLVALALTLLGVRRPAGWALLATGALFAWVKLTVLGSETASLAWTTVAGPSYVRRDPTDLLALPALLVAARVRRLALADLRARARRVAACVGAAALPGALFAVAATGSCWTAHPGIEEVSAVRGRFTGGPAGPETRLMVTGEHRTAYWTIRPDGRLRPVLGGDWARVRRWIGFVASTCLPEHPRECWRPAERRGGLAVERSVDRGRTWIGDYVMGAAEQRQVQREMHAMCDKGSGLSWPADLAAVDTGAGPLVAVAARNAGLLVRLPDGTWHRTPVAALDDLAEREREPSPAPARQRGPLRDVGRTAPPEPTPSPTPAPGGPPSPPCVSPSYVTVTPNPRNGPPFVRRECAAG